MFEANRIKIPMQFFAADPDDKKEDEDKTGDSENESDKNQNSNSNSNSNNSVDQNKDDDEKKDEKEIDYAEVFGMSEADIRKLIQDKKNKDEANKDAETKLAETIAAKSQAEAKVSAMMLGAKPDCVDDVIILATAKSNDGKQFKTVISEIKKKHPDMFTSGDDDNAGKKGTGGSIGNSKNKSDKNAESIGARLGKMKAKKTQSSFFGK